MLLELWDEFINKVRSFYRRRGYIEVSTPVLLNFPNLDSNIQPVLVDVMVRGEKRRKWLQTSPEYSMKKLLAKYKKNIFQIAKVFRNNEYGRLHRVEFHMLEWYKIGKDYRYLIEEIKKLLSELFRYTEFEEITVERAFEEYLEIPFSYDTEELKSNLSRVGIDFQEDEDWETLFYRAFIEVERKLGMEKPTFLIDFPAPLCALAKVKGKHAERFELFIKGIEIANGWTEETNMQEVKRRLSMEAEKRGLPVDEEFIFAHKNMPECAGCSIGIDRLFMLYVNAKSLEDIEL